MIAAPMVRSPIVEPESGTVGGEVIAQTMPGAATSAATRRPSLLYDMGIIGLMVEYRLIGTSVGQFHGAEHCGCHLLLTESSPNACPYFDVT